LGVWGLKVENIVDISVSPIFSVQKYRYRIDFEKDNYRFRSVRLRVRVRDRVTVRYN